MKIDEKALRGIVVDLLKAMDAEEEEAQLVADIMVQAELRGVPTHGSVLLPLIAERKAAGILNVPTKPNTIIDDGAIALIDGNNGIGQMAAAKAMQLSIDKAKKYGVAMTLVRNTNNIGFLGYYPLMAAEEGMIGICMCNAAAALAPWGGSEAFFGTNPLSYAVPVASGPPIVLDMSCSIVARGKVRRADRLKEKIPEGWAFNADGNPTIDPAEALKGTLLPIGGPKGYGLALFIDLLCGLLSGSKYSRDLLTFHKPLGPTGVGVTTIAIDISRFMPHEQFKTLAFEYTEAIRNSKKAKGVDRIFVPGERSAERKSLSQSQGIEMDLPVVEKINKLLKEKGLSVQIEEK